MIRLGILGTASISYWALLRPARSIPETRVLAVASRDPGRAAAYASRHKIARIHRNYEELLRDPEIDAVYVPLPAGLHVRWVREALRAGKHVLVEKPLAANAGQARNLGEIARESGRVLIEAMHYRHHPMAARLAEIMERGVIGSLRRIEVRFHAPSLLRPSFRTCYELGGGAALDLGCYAVSLARLLAQGEPEVTSAKAALVGANVDRAMRADLAFPGGCSGRIDCSMLSPRLWSMHARVLGDEGEIIVTNPFHPYLYNCLRLHRKGGSAVEHVAGRSTFYYQLRAFCRAVGEGEPASTDAAEAAKNLAVIDAIYEAAGLQPRGLAPDSSPD